jgi:hypothetical protein
MFPVGHLTGSAVIGVLWWCGCYEFYGNELGIKKYGKNCTILSYWDTYKEIYYCKDYKIKL